jgi:release factor glutamine methyltransferase
VIAVLELFLKGKSILKDVSDPSFEAKLLLLHCIGISEESFYSHPEREVSKAACSSFLELAARRQKGIPLAYVLGEKEFWSIRFKVSRGVLIPRPETEVLVEKVIELSSKGKERIVDIGTGTGNIAVSLAKELSQAHIIASDVSSKALDLAETNACLQNVPNIEFVKGSLFDPLKKLGFQRKCDFIVSNPPYVSEKEWEQLSEEIKKHEPKRALVPGESGLELIQTLIEEAPDFLRPGGYLCLEIGFGQKKKIIPFFENAWRDLQFFEDLNGIPRVVCARHP